MVICSRNIVTSCPLPFFRRCKNLINFTFEIVTYTTSAMCLIWGLLSSLSDFVIFSCYMEAELSSIRVIKSETEAQPPVKRALSLPRTLIMSNDLQPQGNSSTDSTRVLVTSNSSHPERRKEKDNRASWTCTTCGRTKAWRRRPLLKC